ncbi:SDR family oxidoreductase [uncultured Alsobacter sp.]|uniref:SDR family oxidoreductase n=1 Tax=uncultured Alsobacter sp. TaxID=1748258 RepID=UPI0025E151E9|nr:SDR family oxidoreductase [uncultured Alsobacter sp.]
MNLVVFGHGYSAARFVALNRARFSAVSVTTRSAERASALQGGGLSARRFGPDGTDPGLADDVAAAGAILVSVPPDAQGDPVLRSFGEAIAAARGLRWIGYLSTVGVYGDHAGAWVDETTPCRPVSERSVRRVEAEEGWLALGREAGIPVHVLRLGGIYGPGQNALVNLRDGTARRIVKAGQVFSRIHVDDIAGATAASLDLALARPDQAGVCNVVDDEPAPPQDVVEYAARLMGLPVPPDLPFETATLSPMARSFYGENKRVANRRLHEVLGYALLYPTYREALRALWEAGEGR